MVRLIALFVLIAGAAHAGTWTTVNGFNVGSTYEPVSSTTVNTSTTAVVSASIAIASSETRPMRLSCDQLTYFVFGGVTATVVLSTPTAIDLQAGYPEWFDAPANTVPYFRSEGSSARCKATKIKKP